MKYLRNDTIKLAPSSVTYLKIKVIVYIHKISCGKNYAVFFYFAESAT